jgi:hypothetical protein
MRMESVELIPRRGISLVRAAAARASNPPASATGGSVAGAVKRDATGRMEIEGVDRERSVQMANGRTFSAAVVRTFLVDSLFPVLLHRVT